MLPHENGGTQVDATSIEHVVNDLQASENHTSAMKFDIRYVIDRLREGAFVSDQLMLPCVNHPDVRCTVATWLLVHGHKERVQQVDVYDAIFDNMTVDLAGSVLSWSSGNDTIETEDSLNDFIVQDCEIVVINDMEDDISTI